MLHHLHMCHPVIVVIDSIIVENMIWGDRIGTEFIVMLTVQGFVRCDAGSMCFIIKPKSKDLFMKRLHMRLYGYDMA
jgi:hypothetical protein